MTYKDIAEKYISKVRERYPNLTIRQKSREPFSGVLFTDGSARLTIPKPTSAYNLYIILHECGHFLLGHSANAHPSSVSQDEYDADNFALKTMRSEGVESNDRVTKSMKRSLSNAVYADLWTGRGVSGGALGTIGGEAALQRDAHNWKALQTEIAERRQGVPENKRTYKYKGAYV